MTDDALPPSKVLDQETSRPMIRRFGRIIAGLFVAFILLVVIASLLPNNPSQVARALDEKVAKLRAEGVPLSQEGISKTSPYPPPERDANIVLRDALALAISISDSPLSPIRGGGPMPARNLPIPSDIMAALAVDLSISDSVLQAIPTELRGISFATKFRDLTNDTVISFKSFRALIQACAEKALYESELDDVRKTLDALRKGWGIASTPNGDVLVSAMIRVAAVNLMCDVTEQALNRTRFADAELTGLARLLPIEVVDQLGPAWAAERACGTFWLEMFRQGKRTHYRVRMRMALWRFVTLFTRAKPLYRDEDYLLFLNVFEKMELAQANSLLERVRTARLLQSGFETNAQTPVAILAMPSLAKAVTNACDAKARLIALETALAVERFRLANTNALPLTLDALVPKYCSSTPLDPFDEQPLRYKRLTRGYVVYSIGADGIDNGGVGRDAKKKRAAYDLTITIER